MTRTLLLLAALLSAAPCYSQFVFVPYMAHSNSTFTVPIEDPELISPLDFHFEVAWPDAPDGFKIAYDVHGITPADEGRVFEITDAESASGFGLDYDRIVELSWTHWPQHSVDPDPQATIDTPLGQYNKGTCCGMSFVDSRPRSRIRLDYMRVYISKFDLIANEHRVYFTMQTYLIGQNIREPLPEPASGALLVVAMTGFAALPLRRR